MNFKKLLLICFILICFAVKAQDTLSIPKSKKIFFTEKDIKIDTDTITQKTFPVNLKKKYTDKEFVYEFKTPEKNAWDRFKEWLSNIINSIFDLGSQTAASNATGILLRIIGVLIIVFVVYMIVKSILNKEGSWIFGKNSDKKIIDYTEIEKNLRLVDFEKLIQNTLKSGDNRLSIRYYYLWLLKKLSANEIIFWDVEKTNSDYLYEIKNPAQKQDFEYLSYIYNNIWYGEFELDENTFEKAKQAFEKSIKSLGNG
jgi:preprotein translocase subunit SecG